MRRFSLTVFYSLLIVFMELAVATADDFYLPGEYYGQLNINLPQRYSGLEETLTSRSEKFELVRNFPKDHPYREISAPVGRLDIKLANGRGETFFAFCTASILSSTRILTNNHCVPGTDSEKRVTHVSIVMNYLTPDGADAERYTVDIMPMESNRELDYSILRVNGDPSLKYGVVQLSPRDATNGEPLFIIHHPAAKPKRLTRYQCHAMTSNALSGQNLRHRCDTLGGSSGALVFADKDKAVVGLHFLGGAMSGDPQSYNTAKRVLGIVNQLGASNIPPSIGARVVRGPDWQGGDQGDGTMGTITREGFANGWWAVKWDNGDVNTYRWGTDGKYEIEIMRLEE